MRKLAYSKRRYQKFLDSRLCALEPKVQPCCPKCGNNADTCDCWNLSRKKRNQLQHALNGNRNKGAKKRVAQPKVAQPKRKRQRRQPRTGVSAGAPIQRGKLIGEVTRIPYKEECLGTISTSVNFLNSSYILNAANSSTFPWLSTMARKFEYYRFNKLHLKFVSSSADAVGSTNTALGTMLFNTNYDVLAPAFANQIQMEDYGGGKRHAETIPSKNISHFIEPQGVKGGVSGGFRYNLASSATVAASAPYPASSSAHDYDIGLLQVASAGAQAASVAGRIYICYQVDLANPLLDQGTQGGVVHFSGTVPTTANIFATAVQQPGASLNMQGITLGSNVINFPAGIAGNYLISLTEQAATTAAAFTSLSAGGGCSVLNLITSTTRDATWNITSAAATTGYAVCAQITVTLSALAGTLTFGAGTLVGGGIGMDLFIVGLPSTVLTSTIQTDKVNLEQRLQRQEAMISRLMLRLDLEEEGVVDETSEVVKLNPLFVTSSSSSSSSVSEPLSQSLIGLVGDYVARKSSSNKK